MKSRRIKCLGRVACSGEKRNDYKVVVGKTVGRTQLVRLRRRCEDDIRMDLRGKQL
jgi:hypothetical protein